ncbi:MAG TPA: response regulator transcription factor [Anaerolineales bacterium]|nr:response regulator transcription factor [Anaerolineales bacterium]HNN12343.1 response regulator transcription factor [Anaerolineales bacterium]HNO30633.1 response regulator transcription factor [Anaerolineales bacterium]
MKLLIVDDHVLFREGLASIIRAEKDVEIVGMAGSVREAVEMAARTKPEIVLMDFHLPDGTGADATRAILDLNPKCGIVFLTMSEKDDNLLSAIRSGAKGYLLKSMHPSELVNALRGVHGGESAISRSMTLRLMQELAQPGSGTSERADGPSPTLTRRELDVLRAVADGKSNQEIGKDLFLSENTVKYHVHSILDKLQLKSRREAATYAKDRGLIKKD